ncbi:ComEC family competence protein [Flagellimonas sp. HMM57]|uniref:ComEC/Rec2 family competence protein n=1 Tax=unclassified Flagellimonas TaxID=2644544 RepID=UPI001F0A9EBC|nr:MULTISPECIES: ComEC/Rec2 family competence protein [unclassified Flagellimonas]UII74698.1 ComEC family competence protein [Flagellimonas sp. HMM57]
MGIVIGFYFEIAPLLSLTITIALLPFLYWTYKKQTREGFPFFELTTISTTIALGVVIVTLAKSKDLRYHYSEQNIEKYNLWELKIVEKLKPNPYSQRYVAKVVSLENKRCSGKIILSLFVDSTMRKLRVDNELFVYSSANSISAPSNPHQFNYKKYLEKQGIYHQIQIYPETIIIKDKASTTLRGLASYLRERIIVKLKQRNFGKDELGVIQALLLGQRNDISEETYNSYIDAGAVHILAVSGLHIGILLLLLQFLLSPLERVPKGKTLKLTLIVVLLWSYAFIAGLSPSIVRAVTMFSFFAYAMYLNRPTNSFNIVALSMFFILLMKPLFLFQVGFQMSYAAVFAIVWIYPKLQHFWFPNNHIVRKIWQLMSVSAAAQLGVLPISLFYFHQFPALFFVSNLLIVPFLGLILGLGILVIVLSLLDSLPSFMVQAYNTIIQIMNAIIDWVAHQEGFIIKNIPFDSVQLILGYIIIIFLVLFLSKPKFKAILPLFFGIIVFQGWNIWNQFRLQDKEAFVLLHKSKNTSLLHQNGDSLVVYTTDSLGIAPVVDNYKIAERNPSVNFAPLQHSFSLGNKDLYILDSTRIYPQNKNLDFLVLTQSPKINLERIIDSIQPKNIIADGSNFKSYTARWKATCSKRKIPFHSTREKGSYSFYFKEN